MRTPSRLLVATLALTTITSFSPVATLAAATEIPAAAGGAAFCINLSTTESNVSTQISSRIAQLNQAQATADTKLAAERATVDANVVADRAKADATRQQNFQTLTTKAGNNTTELQAVTTFENTVIAAVTTRRGTVDVARATFRTGVDKAIAAHRSAVASAITTFQASVTSAETLAQNGCSANTAPATIRASFVLSMGAARTTLKTTLQGLDKVTPQVQALATTRNQAFTTADATLTTAVQQAGTTLKTALGSS